MKGDISRRETLKLASTARTRAGGSQSSDEGRHNVGVVPSASERDVDEIADRADSVRRRIDLGHVGVVVTGIFSDDARDRLENDQRVRYVEPDGTVRKSSEIEPWGIDRIDADVVRTHGRAGNGATVAVLDTGIDDDHPDLPTPVQGKCFTDKCCGERSGCRFGLEGYNGNTCNFTWSDDDDHGTHVAGTVAALDDTEGVIGVGPRIDLMAGKVLDGCGGGSTSGVSDGIRWATDNGAHVINMSFGSSSGSSAIKDACQYAVDNNVVLVAAAGNPGNCSDCDCSSACTDCDVSFPAAYSTVIAVSATGPDDGLARYSAVGPEVELAAPGGYFCDDTDSTSILSTIPPESDDDESTTDDDPGYAYFNGTSMASPHVAGVAGLVVAETSLSDNSAIRQHLQSTAEDIGLSSDKQGHGLVDAENAVPLLAEWTFDAGSRIQYASAAVTSSRVFVGGLDDTLSALHRSDGTVDWQYDRTGELADSSPAVSDGTVYVGSGGGTIYALTATDGTVEWTTTTDSAIVSSPVVASGIVYVGSNDGTVRALDDATDGSELWSTDVGTSVFSTPAVASGTVFVTTNDGGVVALDASTGTEQWRFDTDTDTEVGHSSPSVGNGRVYVAADAVYALDSSDGSVLWQTSYGGTVGSSPTYDGTTGQVIVGSADGSVYGLGASDGAVNWTHATGGPVGSTPVVTGDRVLVGSDDGGLYLLDLADGSELVKRSVGQIRTEPVVDSDVAFVGTWSGAILVFSNATTA